MAEEYNTIHAIITGVTVAVLPIFGFVGKRFINKVDETAAALVKHEKEDLGKYAPAEALNRVHERIDSVQRSMEEGFKEARLGTSEIKNILINGVHRG